MKTLRLLTPLFIVFVFALALFANPCPTMAAGSSPLMLQAKSGPASGQVTLTWAAASGVNNYDVLYGASSGKYTWGAQDVGNVTSYTVGGLTPGQIYYFVIQPDATPPVGGFLSDQVSAVAAGKATVAVAKQTQAIQKQQAQAVQIVPSNATAGPVSSPYNLTAKSGPGKGQVTLTWVNSGPSYSFDVVHGPQSGTWLWGFQDVPGGVAGTMNSYTVSSLNPGQVYYFAILPQFNGQGQILTSSVAAVARR